MNTISYFDTGDIVRLYLRDQDAPVLVRIQAVDTLGIFGQVRDDGDVLTVPSFAGVPDKHPQRGSLFPWSAVEELVWLLSNRDYLKSRGVPEDGWAESITRRLARQR